MNSRMTNSTMNNFPILLAVINTNLSANLRFSEKNIDFSADLQALHEFSHTVLKPIDLNFREIRESKSFFHFFIEDEEFMQKIKKINEFSSRFSSLFNQKCSKRICVSPLMFLDEDTKKIPIESIHTYDLPNHQKYSPAFNRLSNLQNFHTSEFTKEAS